jgi:hypothetical protein
MKLIWIFLLFAISAQAQHSNTINWTWSQGTGDSATGFIIQKSTASTGPFTTIITTTTPTIFTYIDSTVTAGQTWYYQILAYNTGGSSQSSNIVEAVTPFLPPTAPSSLQIISK